MWSARPFPHPSTPQLTQSSYICRTDIRSVGYKHFCQHFRQVPGTACRDCGDCDLYADEDEAVAIRRAANAAELEYWVKTGKSWRGVVVETRVLGCWAE